MNSYIVALEGVMAVQSVQASGYQLAANGWWSFYSQSGEIIASFPASRVVMILREEDGEDDGEPSDS